MREWEMKVAIVGTGYVGLTTGLALAYLGHEVSCVDKNTQILDRLRNNEATIFEAGLEELLRETSSRMNFTEDLQQIDAPDVFIIAVGTPPLPAGGTDLRYVEEVAHDVGKLLPSSGLKVVVNKSTVPVGTTRKVEAIIGRSSIKGAFRQILSLCPTGIFAGRVSLARYILSGSHCRRFR